MIKKLTVTNNQQGMTLVELLAALFLVSLVSVVIWTTLAVSTRLNTTEISKLRLQQETNYIATEAQRLHRHCYSYEFVVTPQQVEVQNCQTSTGSEKTYIISTKFLYYTDENELNDVETRYYVNTKTENLTVLRLWLADPENPKLKVSIPLELSRYKQSP
ncbi:type II secretion system protein J [Sporosarcina ureae]|uniref:PulJ/GspJ family protein n=1 Tax=Sporosarcina ureae TaxID=1571 RepID=UPI0026EC75AE|nr:prepilin-type N-terminal cleavage/methylation domain-containing protein [Sporosarcina ureae]